MPVSDTDVVDTSASSCCCLQIWVYLYRNHKCRSLSCRDRLYTRHRTVAFASYATKNQNDNRTWEMYEEIALYNLYYGPTNKLYSPSESRDCSVSTMFLLIALCRKVVLSISRSSSCTSLMSQDMGFTVTNGRPTECSSSAQWHVIGGIVCACVKSVC